MGFCVIEGVAGASPDGLVGDDGLLEFKCPMAGKHLTYLFRDEVPKDYVLQVQGQLWVTGRKWCDFVSYCPGLPIFVKRMTPDKKLQDAFTEHIGNFTKEIAEGKEKLRELNVVSALEEASG